MEIMPHHYDTIVIGAGIEGSATAFQLSKRGVKTLLLEQFPLPHARGSSHGQTRITRKSYAQEFYCRMMSYCSEAWAEVESRAGLEFYKPVGYVAIGPHKGKFLRDCVNAMSQNGDDYEVISPSQLAKRYPVYRCHDNDIGGVLDKHSGILMADRALFALQSLFKQQGGILRDNEKVVSIQPGQIVKVVTSKGAYTCGSLILCCGPWTNFVLKDLNLQLPLQPVRISVFYWAEKTPGSHGKDKMPTFFEEKCCAGYSIFGLPSDEYPGHVKITLHGGPDIDPDSRDRVDCEWVQRLVSNYITEHFPGLHNTPSIVESCIYTNTPDCDFILDRHPSWPNVIIGAGFSGHGFKLAPAVGLILSDLAMGRTPSYDMSHFKISRFQGSKGNNSKL